MFDAMRMHATTAFAAGWPREKSAWYFGPLCDQWMELFFRPTDDGNAPGDALTSSGEWKETLTTEFNLSFTPQREALRQARSELWLALDKGKFDQGQPEWLRWLRGNEIILPEFGENLEKALPSLIHLTNNRLGVNNHDEVYLNYLLAQAI